MKHCSEPNCTGYVSAFHKRFAHYCYKCGKILVKLLPNKCVCGHTLERVDVFCPRCGLKRGGE